LRIGLIELPIASKLTLLGPTNAKSHKPDGQFCQEFFAVSSPVGPAQFVLGDAAADGPVAECEADIDGTAGLSGQVLVDATDGKDEVLEGEA
jgi:hypothetical protein